MRTALSFIALVCFAITSCEYEALPPAVDEPAAITPAIPSFEAEKTGTIAGRVTWSGLTPVAPFFVYGVPNAGGNFTIHQIPNPNLPKVDEKTRAVAGAVVFLRGIDSSRSRPWDHPPVRVEMKDRGIEIVQGERRSRVGFVRRGDDVSMVSLESTYHVLRARGAAFFSLAFPEPNQPLERRFEKIGPVHLSSGAGYYWADATLFVTDHPYFAFCDSQGRFRIKNVPAGPVELVVWLPNWQVVKKERDPETGLIIRQSYGPPLEKNRTLTIEKDRSVEVEIDFCR